MLSTLSLGQIFTETWIRMVPLERISISSAPDVLKGVASLLLPTTHLSFFFLLEVLLFLSFLLSFLISFLLYLTESHVAQAGSELTL